MKPKCLAVVSAFAVIVLWFGWHDVTAGAWLGVGTIAFAPVAIWLFAVRAPLRPQFLRAVEVETLAWTQSD